MPGSILNRLIFWELVKVFLLSLGTLTGLLVMAGLIQQAVQMGLSLSQVARAIPLFIPNTLPYTIPATTLFASCVVYGRLSHDNEVVAIKAAGVHLSNILKPAILLGCITTAATAGLYHTVIPRSQQLLYQQFLEDPEELIYNMLRRDRLVRHPSLPYVIYVRDVQGRRLLDVVIKRRAKVKDGKGGDAMLGYDVVARSREAQLRVDPSDGSLYIYPDRFLIHDKNTSGTTASTGPFQMALPDGMNGKDGKVRVSTITWEELPPKVAELREKLEGFEWQREEYLRTAQDMSTPPQTRLLAESQVPGLKYQADATRRTLRNCEAEFYTRPALAVGCLLFALVGCPVGIWANRADYLSTFVICFLPTLFIYYPLLLAGSGMGKDGKIPLGLGCWLGNIAIALGAVLLNLRLLRR